MTHTEAKIKLIETDQDLTQILELADKDTKTVFTAIFHLFKKLNRNTESIEKTKLNF